MAATDTLSSLDDLLKRTREQHAAELKDANDKLFAAQVELRLTQEALSKQQDRTAAAERFAVKLIAQFATVDAALSLANKAFDDAKAAALVSSMPDQTDNKTITPANGISDVTQPNYTQLANGNGDDGTPHYVAPPPGSPVPRLWGAPGSPVPRLWGAPGAMLPPNNVVADENAPHG